MQGLEKEVIATVIIMIFILASMSIICLSNLDD